MQSAGRRAPEPLAPDELTSRSARSLPELARGAGTLGRLGIGTPRQALFYLPFRYDDFSDLRTLGDLVPDEKQSARVRVVEVNVGAGIRPAPAAGDRSALRSDRHRRGDLVRTSLRRAAPGAGGRDRGERQGHLPWLAAAVHLPGVLAGRARIGPHRAGRAGLPPGGRASRSAGCASCWPASWSGAAGRGRSAAAGGAGRPAAPVPMRCVPRTSRRRRPTCRRARPPRLRRAAGAPADDGAGAPARADLRAARVTIDAARAGALLAALPFELTGDQRLAVDEIVGRPRLGPADAPPAAGRRGERQDGRRRGRAGGRGAGRLAGRADGAHRDPRAPAPPRPRAAPRGARCPRRVPLRDRSPPPPRVASTTPSRRGTRRS